MNLRLFALLLIAGLFTSCDNDLDLTADWKEIPVVYGLLSLTDTAQYVRVERAFLDPERSPLEIARIPDSLYFQGITVQLEDSVTGQRYTLRRVEGEAEGYPRKDGLFASRPNYLYKILSDSLPLVRDRLFRLIITAEDGRVITTSSTRVVGNYLFQSPPSNLNFFYDRSLQISWRSDESSARVYDVKMLIHFNETVAGDPAGTQRRTLEWPLARGIARPQDLKATVRLAVAGVGFYRFLQAQLPAAPNILRQFLGIDLIVDAGGIEMYEAIGVGEANAGITGAEFVPSYSNIAGGFGLFSSRNRLVGKNYSLNAGTLDSLRNGIYTRDLNFQ